MNEQMEIEQGTKDMAVLYSQMQQILKERRKRREEMLKQAAQLGKAGAGAMEGGWSPEEDPDKSVNIGGFGYMQTNPYSTGNFGS